MIQIYDIEAKDGLSDKINQNMSFAYQCLVSKDQSIYDLEEVKKSIAGHVESGRNYDLYHISSILASVGINKNDDVFLPEEIWAAKDTPIHKQVNFGHNEKDIVGAIIGSAILDKDGNKIVDPLSISNINDIISHAVIWSKWDDTDLQDRFKTIVKDIEEGTLFVSMECLFRMFDYLLIKDDVQSVIKRTKETAFLSKYLRILGGEGEYNGYKVYRILRNFTFSGKALVTNPANARSIISDHLADDTTEEEFKLKSEELESSVKQCATKLLAENIMDEVAMNAMKAELAAAKAELENFKKAEAEKVSAAINELKAQNDTLQKQVAELTQVAQAAKEDMEKTKTEAEKDKELMKEECNVKIAEADAKVVAFEAEKVTAERKAQLANANVDSAKAEEVLKTWASVSNEQFADIVKLYASTKSTEGLGKTEGFDLGTTKSTASTLNPNGDSGVDKAVAEEKALAEKIAAQFNFNRKETKGSK
jgi:restriction endonuclease Mrr